jgi:hypothetical protein
LCLFLSIVYSVFQRCPTRDEISFPVGQSNCKKGQNIQKFYKISYKISKFSKKIQNYKIIFFCFKVQNFENFIKILKFQNFQRFHKISKFSSYFKILILKIILKNDKNNCSLFCWNILLKSLKNSLLFNKAVIDF